MLFHKKRYNIQMSKYSQIFNELKWNINAIGLNVPCVEINIFEDILISGWRISLSLCIGNILQSIKQYVNIVMFYSKIYISCCHIWIFVCMRMIYLNLLLHFITLLCWSVRSDLWYWYSILIHWKSDCILTSEYYNVFYEIACFFIE